MLLIHRFFDDLLLFFFFSSCTLSHVTEQSPPAHVRTLPSAEAARKKV